MIKIYQTRFGGVDAPKDEQGNCFQACIATILQMPLEEAFDCTVYEDDMWFEEFNKWLSQYNLACIFIHFKKGKWPTRSKFMGFTMLECQNETLYNGENHVVVMCGEEFFHDPNPNASKRGEAQGIYIFTPIEAYRLVRR